jgi:hypothetical protein
MRSLRKDSAIFNQAGDAWASADVIAGVTLNLPYDVHPLDTLAENDVSSVAPCTGVGGDEELGEEEAE